MRNYDLDGTPEGVFGAELRYYRTAAGLSQAELGALVNVSDVVISKIETGERAPARGFAERLDAVPQLDTRAALGRLWKHLSKSARRQGYPGWFADWVPKEAEAATLRFFQPVIVPGLLQTEDYARTIFGTRFKATSDEIDEQVAARMKRQEILERENPPGLWVILDEAVLRRPVGGRHVMCEQVNRLAEAARQPHIVMEIVPASVGAHEGLESGFAIAEFKDAPSVGYREGAGGGHVAEEPQIVTLLALIWDTLRADTLPRAASLVLLEEVAKSWALTA
jgi:transcriptional regulator with XRE-family HTH domain